VGCLHYLLDRRLGEPQSRSERRGEEKNSHNCTCRILNSGRPARSLVVARQGSPIPIVEEEFVTMEV
jgi:hypothetical protein